VGAAPAAPTGFAGRQPGGGTREAPAVLPRRDTPGERRPRDLRRLVGGAPREQAALNVERQRLVAPSGLTWATRPHAPGEPTRHVAELSDALGLEHVRANVWRYEPGAAGKRHRHRTQEEVYVVLSGTLTVYLGDPPERHVAEPGAVVRVAAGTPVQCVNHGDADVLLYAHGWPGEDKTADLLDPAV
jgi:uncharacterized cupin superfamily protein